MCKGSQSEDFFYMHVPSPQLTGSPLYSIQKYTSFYRGRQVPIHCHLGRSDRTVYYEHRFVYTSKLFFSTAYASLHPGVIFQQDFNGAQTASLKLPSPGECYCLPFPWGWILLGWSRHRLGQFASCAMIAGMNQALYLFGLPRGFFVCVNVSPIALEVNSWLYFEILTTNSD